ncbi:MAG: hypothetical protein WCG25_08205 [bacterium]
MMTLIAIGANDATINIAKAIHAAIDTKIESFHGHSDYEEQFQVTIEGIINSFNTVITAFENAKTTCTLNGNYSSERNKETLHNNIVAIQQDYAHIV